MNYSYIVIEGNIGAGKTSLATKISEQYQAQLILEQFEENSFLPKFYQNPEKYAFPLELSFLAERYNQLKELLSKKDIFKKFVVADYFIDKSLIFAQKNLQNDEYLLYYKLFKIINPVLPKPDLLVYLYKDIDNLVNNIKLRGRSYEQNIAIEYLSKIQDGYITYMNQLKNQRILLIDTNNIDFVNIKSDYEKIVNLIFKDYPIGLNYIT